LPDDIEMADKILCDVPCSGYGVIRKKPEIKYKDINENESLPDIQYKILLKASSRLKKGGTLVYSTCTLSKAENENNVEKFLAENPDFEAVNPLEFSEKTKDMKYVTLFPEIFGSDGFFIAKLIKRK
jgi:16S rRNA (cytosine967-C5)-methyltransferase